VLAGRLKAALAEIDRMASTTSARAPRSALPAEQADFQIPGQTLSLKTGVAYLKQLFGRPDINIDVDITEDADGFTAQVRANPPTRNPMGPLHFRPKTDRNEMVRAIAETIMGGVKPLVLASYRTAFESARCAAEDTGACDYSVALALYRNILADPHSTDHQWALLGRCKIYSELGNTEGVRQACGQAIALYPDFDRPYVIRAASSIETDVPAASIATHVRAASADLERAIENNPNNASAYFYWGELLYKTQKFDRAAEKFAQAERIEPGHVPALLLWGDALASAGRQAEAAAVYRRALLIAPEDESARAGWEKAARIQADPAIHVARR